MSSATAAESIKQPEDGLKRFGMDEGWWIYTLASWLTFENEGEGWQTFICCFRTRLLCLRTSFTHCPHHSRKVPALLPIVGALNP